MNCLEVAGDYPLLPFIIPHLVLTLISSFFLSAGSFLSWYLANEIWSAPTLESFPSSSFWPFNLHQFMEVIPLNFHNMTNAFLFFHFAIRSIGHLFTPKRICAGIIITNKHEVVEVEFLHGALIEQHNHGGFRTLGWAFLIFLAVWAMCGHKQLIIPTLVKAILIVTNFSMISDPNINHTPSVYWYGRNEAVTWFRTFAWSAH